jgi:arylsulfatase A-like enzyme
VNLEVITDGAHCVVTLVMRNLAFALFVTALACGSNPPPDPIRVGEGPIVRLIREEPQSLLNPSELIELTEAEVWPVDLGAWSLESTGKPYVRGDDAHDLADGRLIIVRDLRLESSRIHAVDLETAGSERTNVRLFWASDGEPFTMQRSIKLGTHPDPQKAETHYRAELANQPRWRGEVRRLRLVMAGSDGLAPRPVCLVGLRPEMRWSRLKDVRRLAWKVALDHEVRNSVLAPQGTPIEYRLDIAGSCELRVAFGLPAGRWQSIVFRATAIESDEKETVLFEQSVGPEDGATGQWLEATASLERWQGQELRVVLSTSSALEPDLPQGVPMWADPHVIAVGSGLPDVPNLLVVSIDTLRADRMSLHGYPVPTTPFIDAWARDNAVVFSTVVAPAPWTLPSHVSLFSGLDAERHGINHDVGGVRAIGGAASITSLDLMAERLGRVGYETAAFTGGAYVHPQYGFAQGFDRFSTWPDRARDELELETGIDRTLEWMAGRSTAPFFAFLHTYAVHDPYRVRQPYFDRVAPIGVEVPDGRVALISPPNDPATGFLRQNQFVFRPSGGGQRELMMDQESMRMVSALYDCGVAYADAQIGRLLGEMAELGLAQRTVIVLTSDHGESLGERGQMGHIYLSDDNLLVPLVISVPGGLGAGRVVHDQVRLIDVLPTVLDLVGLESGAEFDGVSLVPLMIGNPSPVPPVAWSYSAAANRGLAMRVDGQFKYTINNTAWAQLVGRQQLFDLTSDPAEIHNLVPGDERAETLRETAMLDFERRAVGLRLRVQSGDGRLQGSISGPAVRPVGTKFIGLETGAASCTEIGEASIDVPPGSEFALHFEKVFGLKLTVNGSYSSEVGLRDFHHTFNVRDEDEVESLVLDEKGWHTVERPMSADEIGFSVRWHGGVRLGGPSAASVDSELAKQLEALGYIQ